MFPSNRNRGGRPRKGADTRLSNTIAVRFKRDEIAEIERRAAAAGVTVSEYIRAAIKGSVTIRQVRGLNAIDEHDLNQIARLLDAEAPAAIALRTYIRRHRELVD